MAKCFLGSLGILFSDDIDVEICADPLLDNFKSNCVIFLFLLGLGGGSWLISQAIYNVSDFFLLKHGLREVGALGPIFEAPELFSFAFVVILFASNCVGKEAG